jgi:hypothetical protein
MTSQKRSRQLRKQHSPERHAQLVQAARVRDDKLVALAAAYEPRFQAIERIYHAARHDVVAEFQARKTMIEQATLLEGK